LTERCRRVAVVYPRHDANGDTLTRNQPTSAAQRALYRAPRGVYRAELRDTRSSTLIPTPGASGGTRTPALAVLAHEATVNAVRHESHLLLRLRPGIGRRHIHHRCREEQYCSCLKCTGPPLASQSTPRSVASSLRSSSHSPLTVQRVDCRHSYDRRRGRLFPRSVQLPAGIVCRRKSLLIEKASEKCWNHRCCDRKRKKSGHS